MMKIVELSPSHEKMWDRFIDESENGTIFHKLKFLSYHEKCQTDKINHLLWLKGSDIYAVFPFFIRQYLNYKSGNSPVGSSFGGIIVRKGINLEKAIDIVDSLIEYCKRNDIVELNITFPPNFYSTSRQEYLQFAFFKRGAELIKRDLFHYISLGCTYQETLTGFSSSCRNKIKNSGSIFNIYENAEIMDFYNILLEDKNRQRTKPTHSLFDLLKLKSLFPKKISVDIAICKENGSKAGICYFECSKKISMAFYMCQDDNALGYNGVNALLEVGIKRSISEGKSIIDFGSSTFGYEISNIGVSKFKESFNASSNLRDTIKLLISK